MQEPECIVPDEKNGNNPGLRNKLPEQRDTKALVKHIIIYALCLFAPVFSFIYLLFQDKVQLLYTGL